MPQRERGTTEFGGTVGPARLLLPIAPRQGAKMKSVSEILWRVAALLFAVCSVAASAAEPPFAPPASERILYRNATLVDGDGARAGMTVVTRGPLIEAVLPDAEVTPALRENGRVVDLTGRYLLPGLIDSHQHLATPPNRARAEALMRRQLYSGVTATRIMADDLRAIAELARAALVGEIAGPDMAFAAVAAGPSFFDDPRTLAIGAGWRSGETPWAQAIDDRTDLPLAIARARGTGATALKIYANLPPHLVRRLTADAHRQGMRVWTHGMVFPTPPAAVIAAGPDVISHTCYLAYQLSNRRPSSYQERFPVNAPAFSNGDNPVLAGLFREMRRRGIILDATLRVYREGERRATAARPAHCTLDLAARLTDQARRKGVAISAGTDGETSRADGFPSLFEELELLVARAGFTPAQAIRAATETGAAAMGESARMGRIASGLLANFLVTARNPLDDIAHLRTIQFTVKRGRRFERGDYRPITAAEMPGND